MEGGEAVFLRLASTPLPKPWDPRLGGTTFARILCEEKALGWLQQMRARRGPQSQSDTTPTAEK